MKRTHVLFAIWLVAGAGLLLVPSAEFARILPVLPFGPAALPAIAISMLGTLCLIGIPALRRYSFGLPPPLMLVGAAVFAAIAVLSDVLFGFPAGINITLPHSLLFYPGIALTAEMAFHVLPLALVALVIGQLDTRGVYAVALIEPAFQIALAPAVSPLAFMTFLNILAFNLYELHALRRHGVSAMILCRIVYYLIWHVAWGEARLVLLF